jgi:hypothetical protein
MFKSCLQRELALKKKHDELLSSEPRCPEYATAVDNRVASSSWPKHEVSGLILLK